MDSTWNAVFGFFNLLLFPLLGMLALLKRRASPVLKAVVAAWVALGALALIAGWYPGLTRAQFLRGWWMGAVLGGTFLAIDWLRTRKKVAKGLKLALAAITIAVFVKALHDFLRRYG